MSVIDPTEMFRQEAQELLEQLEQALLDLEHSPSDHGLIDTAFRALHTIKGSGAMFGFDAVAAFTHHVETAFDQVRQGIVPASPALIAVALAAKDHMRLLIDQPEAAAEDVAAAILGDLGRIVGTTVRSEPPRASIKALAEAATWRIRIILPPDALATGTNPLLLLDELRSLGHATVTARTDRIPPLAELDPTLCHVA